jgi:hypothetical protein
MRIFDCTSDHVAQALIHDLELPKTCGYHLALDNDTEKSVLLWIIENVTKKVQ